MSHRTQITLADEQYELLCRESKRSGVAIAKLVRRALDEKYAERAEPLTGRERFRRFERSFGAWADRPDWPDDKDGAAYVERIRESFEDRLGRHVDRR